MLWAHSIQASWRFNQCTVQILLSLLSTESSPWTCLKRGIKACRRLAPSWLSTKALGEHPEGSRSCPKKLAQWKYHGAMQEREEHDSIHTHHTTKSERAGWGGGGWGGGRRSAVDSKHTMMMSEKYRVMGSGSGFVLMKSSEMIGWLKE